MEHETFSNIDARLQKLWLLRIITFHCRFYFDHLWTFNFCSASQVKRPFIQTFHWFVAPLESVWLVPKNTIVTTLLKSVMRKPFLETILARSFSICLPCSLDWHCTFWNNSYKNITYSERQVVVRRHQSGPPCCGHLHCVNYCLKIIKYAMNSYFLWSPCCL